MNGTRYFKVIMQKTEQFSNNGALDSFSKLENARFELTYMKFPSLGRVFIRVRQIGSFLAVFQLGAIEHDT